jgi:hypothetical protein
MVFREPKEPSVLYQLLDDDCGTSGQTEDDWSDCLHCGVENVAVFGHEKDGCRFRVIHNALIYLYLVFLDQYDDYEVRQRRDVDTLKNSREHEVLDVNWMGAPKEECCDDCVNGLVHGGLERKGEEEREDG